MNKTAPLSLILLFWGLFSCQDKTPEKKHTALEQTTFLETINGEYELYKPAKNVKAVLVLFGGFPEEAKDIKREFKILEKAKENNIAVIFLNYNQKLWLEEHEKYQLAGQLQEIVGDNNLPSDNIYIGGFSSGGVISLLISNYIAGMKEFYIDPKGVFIVDAPIDLSALYASSEKNLERNFSKVSVQESTWIIETLENAFGSPDDDIQAYEERSVFTHKTDHTANLKQLKDTKIRLYTEPDTLWWKKNRMADYDQMNAYYIEKLSESLKAQGFNKVEYIPTENKGYRANGERHPHSWSIVDTEDLIKWMMGGNLN